MEYEGQICRSPMERSSFMLPVMVGCSYNRCQFCMLFKHLTYRRLPMDQIFADIRRVADLGGDPKWVFLGDGNAFSLPAEDLLAILQEIRRAFPSCQGVNMDATVTSIAQKTDEQLELLAKAGVSHLYLGIESGLDDVLRLMDKDHTKAQAMEQIRRIQQAGMVFDAHIMTGVAGKGRGRENALALGEFFRRTRPSRVVNFSMFIHRRAPLYQLIQQGKFVPADEGENLEEERVLLHQLWNMEVEYDGFHDILPLRVRGKLPEDREKMLKKLEKALGEHGDAPWPVALVD